MTTLDDFAALAARDHGLVVVTTQRADHTMQASVVNAGVLEHPRTGQRVLGLVARSDSLKIKHVRVRPRVTVVARASWEWAAVEGDADVIGPDDPAPGIDAEELRVLLRAVFVAAGGAHDDWPTYDRVMAEERRAALFVTPRRVYSNGS
ncbi:MAG TPA: pyridoxamine 5'-phosphate oxidase [Acidimicrobiia bacterium]|nr:pyridoxamine 5'-phosphate oxidase [Acidimicrobiia bacterium]